VTIQTIIIDEKSSKGEPTVKLIGSPALSVWEYVGSYLKSSGCHDSEKVSSDLNGVAQRAASMLADKVASRKIEVELIINPLIPPIKVDVDHLVNILMMIGENASASVEPGPGTIILKTWWKGKFAGVDAIGRNGILPSEIRRNLMRPGFSTRVADWDTGFGLHAASEAARAIDGRVEILELPEGIGFRLAVPVRVGTPLSPPEAMVGLEEEEEKKETVNLHIDNWPPMAFWEIAEGKTNVGNEESYEA